MQVKPSVNKLFEYKKFIPCFIISVFSVVMFIVTGIIGYTPVINNIFAVASIIVSLYLCYIYRYNIGMFLVMLMILYTNYSVAVGVYLDPGIRPAFIYDQFTNVKTYGAGIVCIYLFVVAVLLFSYKAINEPNLFDSIEIFSLERYEYKNIIAYGGLILYLLLFFTGIGYGTAQAGRASITPLSEYRVIVEIIALYYSGNKKIFKYLWTVAVGITCIMTLIGGNRVDMFASVIVLIIFWYSDLLDYRRILKLLPLAVVLFAGVGFLRTSFSLSVDALRETINTLVGDKITYEGAIFGYTPSLAIVELTEKIPPKEKWDLLVSHILYIFYPGESNFVNLSTYSHSYYNHFAGFVSPPYFYFWFGYLGAIFLAGLVYLYTRFYYTTFRKKRDSFADKLKYILSIYFISNVGRWYCYGPMSLLRNMFVCIVAFTIVFLFIKLLLPKGEKFLEDTKQKKRIKN